MPHVLSKSAFAASVGVSPGRLSHWLREGKIDGDAVIGSGYSARINADLARAQLDSRLSISQRLGANGKVQLDTSASPASVSSFDPVTADIKAERLAQLRHFNQRAAEEAALRAGAFVKTADVQQQFGAIAARLMSAFEASFMPIANAIVAAHAQTPQDVLRTMRTTWREVRAQAAKAQSGEALVMPPLVDGDTDAVSQQ